MISKDWTIRAAMAAGMALAVQGCASSPNRMPPAGGYAGPAYAAQPGYAPAPYAAAPAPYAAAPAPYAAPAPAPYPTAPYPAAAPFPAAPVVADLPAATTGITGVTERKPDLCKASSYASSVGQPGSTIPTLGLPGAYRVVEYRGIEPQDYDPDRLVFRLDATGTITKIDCG
ncbi:hypothetical protein [Paracoccus sp. Arc7-R13]|uniref:hypothetical protein n=1 Tax=Paracoccus sp. Arc7-R13 TaxID=2500532 RepID=UPI001981BC7F|nr:hypothetical protein [Paracoccus sp. Arc7-R13]